MNGPTIASALDQAGNAVKLLWKPNAPAPKVPVMPPEFDGWRQEQKAWMETVALFDLSHHMFDLFIEGPDAVRLLSHVSANNYEKFAVGQAKQFITVGENGSLMQDGILVRLGDQKFNLIGIGAAVNWVVYHATQDNYDVTLTSDPTSDFRQGNPVLYRIQIQGPKAGEMLTTMFGDQLDDIKFFHFREVRLGDVKVNALRHGMAGQAGFEFFGPWEDVEFVKGELLRVGKDYGLGQVGGLAYYSAGVDSGWLATPVPAIYTTPELAGYRAATSLYSYEGMMPLQGSFYSPNIEDYYVSPYELGYGRSISFNHDFVGKDALAKAKDNVRRTKVTLIWNKDDVERVFGKDRDFFLSYTKDRVEIGSDLVGTSEYATSSYPDDEIRSIALVDKAHAAPGTEVVLVWGQHPGPDADASALPAFERIRAVVQPSPYNEFARSTYRAD